MALLTAPPSANRLRASLPTTHGRRVAVAAVWDAIYEEVRGPHSIDYPPTRWP